MDDLTNDTLTVLQLNKFYGELNAFPDAPAVLYLSPELYHDIQQQQHTEPEEYAMPVQAVWGIPVVVDPDLPPGAWKPVYSKDLIEDLRVATDAVSSAMIDNQTAMAGTFRSLQALREAANDTTRD